MIAAIICGFQSFFWKALREVNRRSLRYLTYKNRKKPFRDSMKSKPKVYWCYSCSSPALVFCRLKKYFILLFLDKSKAKFLMLTLFQVHSCFLRLFKINILSFYSKKSWFDLILQSSNPRYVLLESKSPYSSNFHRDRGRSLTVLRL